ncbi:MAG: septum formation inhibitor Maf [Lachnospiraceae bacterium]|nr:septum formation inhibitor Maf [Lachnospiraceae bacterium]
MIDRQDVLVLASRSPRRRELLSQVGISFRMAPGTVEERITKTAPDEVVRELSFQKAEDVASGEPEGVWVLGADTVVALDGKILGKPTDAREAKDMLRQLSGRSHSVYTGVTLYRRMDGKTTSETFSEETKVTFYPMTEEEICRYVDSGDPMDKAGAYGIQGPAAAFIQRIEGDYNNVVGLPVAAVYQRWKEKLQYGK